MLIARREERLRALAEEIGGEYEVCDVADRSAVDAAAARVLERHPLVHLLVNNAGIPARASFLEGEPEAIENALRTNYLGGVWCLRAFLPGLEAAAPSDVVEHRLGRGRRRRIRSRARTQRRSTLSSRSHVRPPRSSGARGIRVHTVKPGFVETEGFPQGWLPARMRRLVIGPEQVAEHVSSRSSAGEARRPCRGYYGVAGGCRRCFRMS